MNINVRICLDYVFANNNFGPIPHTPIINTNDIVNTEADIEERKNRRLELINKYDSKNVNRDIIIDLFNNDAYDEIKKLLCRNWQSSDINDLLFEYCIKQNDIDFLNIIIEKDKNISLFCKISVDYNAIKNIFGNIATDTVNNILKEIDFNAFDTNNLRKYVKLIIDLDRYDMCKFILTRTELSPEAIDEFLHHGIRTQKINFLDLFSEFNHKMSTDHIIRAIINNNIDIVKYIIANNYDIQTVFDTCTFYNHKNHDASCDILMSVPMLELLVDHQISIYKKLFLLALQGAKYNSLELVEYCYKCESTIDINTILVVAILNNSENIIKYALEAGADINSKDLVETNFEVIKLCLKYNPRITPDEINQIFARHFVSEKIDDLQILIEYGANPNYIFSQENKFEHNLFTTANITMDKKYHLLNSKLEYIVSMGKISHIDFLADVNFDKLEPELNRLFIIACANGHTNMVEYLLNLGADIRTEDNLAFISACFFGHLHIVELLLDRGVQINTITQDLFMLTVYGSIPTGKFTGYAILIKNVDTIFRNDLFNFGKNHLDIFKLLMENNVPVLNFGIFNILPSTYYNNDIFTYLLSHCANINLDEILNICIIQKNITITKFLLDYGANANSITCCENDEIKKLLIEYGYNEEK